MTGQNSRAFFYIIVNTKIKSLPWGVGIGKINIQYEFIGH